jgi:hypothetical protein
MDRVTAVAQEVGQAVGRMAEAALAAAVVRGAVARRALVEAATVAEMVGATVEGDRLVIRIMGTVMIPASTTPTTQAKAAAKAAAKDTEGNEK